MNPLIESIIKLQNDPNKKKFYCKMDNDDDDDEKIQSSGIELINF